MNGPARRSKALPALASQYQPKKSPARPAPSFPVPSQRSLKRADERARREAARAAKQAILNPIAPPAPLPASPDLERILLTPEFAMQLLEHNSLNRPVSDGHVGRIARQIIEGKWKYNGDTIKISTEQEVLDGQHRLWAIIEAQMAVETVIVYGIERAAFSTIDTVRRLRTGGDTIALNGVKNYRNQIAGALGWLLRWQKGMLETYKVAENRVENCDIEAAFEQHPGLQRAAEAAMKVRTVANPAVIAFAYYVMSNRNQEIADQFLDVLRDPTSTALSHPFFRLRNYFLADRQKKKDPVMSIALIFKAANLVNHGREVTNLSWRSQGSNPEAYPILQI
jgi:hypothetical protein